MNPSSPSTLANSRLQQIPISPRSDPPLDYIALPKWRWHLMGWLMLIWFLVACSPTATASSNNAPLLAEIQSTQTAMSATQTALPALAMEPAPLPSTPTRQPTPVPATPVEVTVIVTTVVTQVVTPTSAPIPATPSATRTVPPATPMPPTAIPPTATPTPPAAPTQLTLSDVDQAGLVVYRAKGCGACHTLNIAGSVGTAGPSHQGLATTALTRIADPAYTGTATTAEEYLRESILMPNLYATAGYSPEVMPSFAGISETSLNALIQMLLAN